MTENKTSITFIQHATEVSGSLMSLLYTVQGLQKNGAFEITILCKSAEIAKWYQDRSIKAEHLPSIMTFGHCSGHSYRFSNLIDLIKFFVSLLKLPSSIFQQKKHFDKSSDQIIHLNSSTLLASAIAARLSGKTLIWHIREMLSNGIFGIRKLLWRKFYLGLAHKIICISEMEASAISPSGDEKIVVIYNFIPFDDFKTSQSREEFLSGMNLAVEKKYLLSLGGSNPIKATSTLLKSLKFLDEDYQALIAGDCRFYQDFNKSFSKKLISILKILMGSTGQLEYWRLKKLEKQFPDRIHFTGAISHIPDIIESSHALFFGFTIPHFPRPVFEAWYLNRPALSYRLHGLKNHIDHNENGLLVEAGDHRELARQIKRLEDPAFYQKLAASGHKKALEKFDLSKNSEKLISLYRSLIKG
jgi:glycosyltransferase involved in cell wall biosynthesis